MDKCIYISHEEVADIRVLRGDLEGHFFAAASNHDGNRLLYRLRRVQDIVNLIEGPMMGRPLMGEHVGTDFYGLSQPA